MQNDQCYSIEPNHICPQCQGTKNMQKIIFLESTWTEVSFNTTCDICNGTGHIDSATLEQIMTPPDSNTLNMEDIPF